MLTNNIKNVSVNNAKQPITKQYFHNPDSEFVLPSGLVTSKNKKFIVVHGLGAIVQIFNKMVIVITSLCWKTGVKLNIKNMDSLVLNIILKFSLQICMEIEIEPSTFVMDCLSFSEEPNFVQHLSLRARAHL